MTEWDERELERLMKDGLEARAREADVDVAVAVRAREAAGSARWRTAAAAGLVAASVAAVAGGVAVLRDDDGGSGGATGEPTNPTVVEKWRTEYWHDIRVDVPADWGWGGSPMAETRTEGRTDGLMACAAGPFRAPGKKNPEWATTPYVGRPFLMTDVCEIFRDGQWREPQAPYLWFGSPIEPGTREFDNGYVQETIEFEGEPVTVATDDPSLRQQILDSVTGGETCMSEYEGTPPATAAGEGGLDVSGVTVCAYRNAEGTDLYPLAYAVELDAGAADRLMQAVIGSDRVRGCERGADDGVTVQLNLHGKSGTEDFAWVVNLGDCPRIDLGSGDPRKINEVNTSIWDVDGLPTILFAAWAWDELWMSDYFVGPQG